jgi:uncharacterized protein involved in exopolysaccharide biosynthesis
VAKDESGIDAAQPLVGRGGTHLGSPLVPPPIHGTPVAAAAELQQQGEQPAGSLVYALLRFRGCVGAVTLLGALLGLVLGLMQANSFTSSGTLLLRSGARETATAESTVAGRDAQDVRPFDFLANEIQILSHRDAFHRVIEKVGVDRLLEAYDPSAADDAGTSVPARVLHWLQSWWFASSSEDVRTASPAKREFLAQKLLTTDLLLRASGSSVIRVSCEAHTADLAKAIVDAFLVAAEEHHRQVFSNRTSFEFLTVMEKQSREAAETASDRLLEFKRKHGIFDLGAQRTAIIADIDKLETQLAADEQDLQAHESRCEFERRLLASAVSQPEVEADGPPLATTERAALQEQILTLENQAATARGEGLDRSQTELRVKALRELIAVLERRLDALPPTRAKNARHDRLAGLLDDDELKVVELRVSRDRQAARLEQLRARVQGLDEIAPCYDALVDEVSKHENDSKRFLESLGRAELLNLLDENKLSNLRILEPGDLPVEKSGPNRALRTLFGAACGLLVGICVALLRQRFDGSVQRAQDLEEAGAEVLGVVPETRALAAHAPQDAGADDAHGRALRRRLDGLWAGVLPAGMPRDFPCTIAMVGDERSPGVTTLALHCAVRAASCHHLEVLLIETNYLHPTLAGWQGLRLGPEGAPGLAELLGGTASRDEVVRPTQVPGLSIVHAGAHESLRDAARGGMRAMQAPQQLLQSLANGFDVVILDVPSIIDHPEFRQFAWCADVVVPICAAGHSTKDGVRGLLQAIAAAGKHAPGAILNRWRSIRPFWLPRSLDV